MNELIVREEFDAKRLGAKGWMDAKCGRKEQDEGSQEESCRMKSVSERL